MDLGRFFFSEPASFLIPIEHLCPRGMSSEYAAELRAERGMSEAWIARFDAGFARYFDRLGELFRRAPGSFFPPRLQNLFVVTDVDGARPYFQPFPKTSWQLYASDFEPDSSSVELACYQFVHAERMGLKQSVVNAFIHNLGYWMVLDDAELDDFRLGAERARGPDADAFRALAASLPVVKQLYHEDLRPPPDQPPEPLGRVTDAGLFIPESLKAALQELAGTAKSTAARNTERYFAKQAQRTGDPSERLSDWLGASAPRALIVAGDQPLWDADEPGNLDALGEALAGMGDHASASVRADLEVIDRHSRRFLAAVKNTDALPTGDVIDQSGGVYIHEKRRLIVYDVAHPFLNRAKEGSFPYQRWLLGARCVHEWGHLAVEADWVRVPEARKQEFEAAFDDVALLFGRLVSDADGPLRDAAARELESIGGKGRDAGPTWASWILTRMPDFLTNLLARRFLDPEEMEAYARANVYAHIQDEPGVYRQLVRYAYEVQYLGLTQIADPAGYFVDSTWFRELIAAPGVATVERMEAILRAVGRLCACYEIDAAAFIDLN
jgi:hypothetical protein